MREALINSIGMPRGTSVALRNIGRVARLESTKARIGDYYMLKRFFQTIAIIGLALSSLGLVAVAMGRF